MTIRAETGYCVLVRETCQYSASQVTWAQGQPRRSQLVDSAYMDWAMPIIQRRITQAGNPARALPKPRARSGLSGLTR